MPKKPLSDQALRELGLAYLEDAMDNLKTAQKCLSESKLGSYAGITTQINTARLSLSTTLKNLREKVRG